MEKEGNCSVGGWLPGRGHSEQRFKGADQLVLVGACLTGSQFLCCKGKVQTGGVLKFLLVSEFHSSSTLADPFVKWL